MNPRALILAVLFLGSCTAAEPSSEDWFARGNHALDRGDYESALESYTRTLELNPRFARALNNRGMARAFLGDLDGAIKDYDACLNLPTPLAEAYYNRGVARFRREQRSEAVEDFTTALKILPGYIRAFAARGLVLAASGDVEGARADFRKALELAPADWPDRKSLEAELQKLPPPTDKK